MLIIIPAQTNKFSISISWKLQVCLSMYDLSVDIKHWRVKDFFSKFDSFSKRNFFSKFFSKSFLRIQFTKKSLMENFNFCAVNVEISTQCYRLKRNCNWVQVQRQTPEVFHEKNILKNFSNFTWRHLWSSLFLIKL